MTTYKHAADYLHTKTDRPLPGRSTRLIRRDADRIAVRYHATDVVTYHADGRIVLESGGYRSVTTKARINEYTPARVWSERGIWRVAYGGQTVPFDDGITLHPDGTITGAGAETAPIAARLRKHIRAYIEGYCAHVRAQELAFPGGGDCWDCLAGDALGVDHYLTHFREHYYVPSLARNAVRGLGAGPAYWALMLEDARRGDAGMLRRALRSHFRRVTPALVAALEREVR